jgi:cytochrome c peroxidase
MKAIVFLMAGLFICTGYYATGIKPNRPTGITTTELGEMLFFDPILSKDMSISCASCHRPEFGFADNKKLSIGVDSQLTRRNAPSVMYIDMNDAFFFWDGRAQTVEHQAFFPITNPGEMGLSKNDAVTRVNKKYLKEFKTVFGSGPTVATISKCLADFQRSLAYYNSPYDRFYNGDDAALSKEALRGLDIFTKKGRCVTCHLLYRWFPDTTAIRNIGLYNGKEYNDQGYFETTGDSFHLGRFKTPHMRNLSFTAPYMHDGSMKTLREVIKFYDKPKDVVKDPINVDPDLRDSLGLTEKEMDDLEAFLLSLNDDSLSHKVSRYTNRFSSVTRMKK